MQTGTHLWYDERFLCHVYYIQIDTAVTGIFLLSQEHSQRDQIYGNKILFNCTVTPSPNSICTYGTRFSSTICIGKKFIQDENGKIVCPFFFY